MSPDSTADVIVTMTVSGSSIGRPGTEWYERVRTALWEALDEVEVYATDNDGEDVGPYELTVTGISPTPRRTR